MEPCKSDQRHESLVGLVEELAEWERGKRSSSSSKPPLPSAWAILNASWNRILNEFKLEATIAGSGRDEVCQTIKIGIVLSKFDTAFADGSFKEISTTGSSSRIEIGMTGPGPFLAKQVGPMEADEFIFLQSHGIKVPEGCPHNFQLVPAKIEDSPDFT